MAMIAQTIAIVDKSGKVVSSSKQLKNVFQEAKYAYMERKAEIKADRKAREDRELQKAIKAMSVYDDDRSERSHSQSRPRGHRSQSGRDRDLHVRPPTERHRSSASVRSGYSSSSPTAPNDRRHSSSRARHASVDNASEYEHDYYSPTRSSPVSPLVEGHRRSNELVRRRTDMQLANIPAAPPRPGPLPRSNSMPMNGIDMDADLDLAYGDFHPELHAPGPLITKPRGDVQKQELSSLVLKCKMLLDEANCAQHSVKAIMAHLQKNPDAMAAVALTLAEISNIASKMAPGALTVLKAGAPSVFALLAAPEFLIAVGVSVGITVVMFGGYKIIKKIRAKAASDKEGSMDEMINVDELNHIEHWRRGIAEEQMETASVATSVEGEFISPVAARSMGHLPSTSGERDGGRDDGRRRQAHATTGGGSHRPRADDDTSSRSGSVQSESKPMRKTMRRGGNSEQHLQPEKERALIKVKKPSPLRRMFHSSSAGGIHKGSSVAS